MMRIVLFSIGAACCRMSPAFVLRLLNNGNFNLNGFGIRYLYIQNTNSCCVRMMPLGNDSVVGRGGGGAARWLESAIYP